MQDNGWIKLHRCLLDKAAWNCLTAGQKCVMITILLLANREEHHWMWKGKKYDLKPGQFITSLSNLSLKAQVSIQTVRSALEKLETLEFITRESTHDRTLISVLNWGIYQAREDEPNTRTNTQQAHEPTNEQQTSNKRATTNKNIRSKEGYIYTAQFESAWNAYPRKEDKKRSYECYKARVNEGYSEEELLSATKKYADKCKAEKTAPKYIKKAYTFWGVNAPFLDYMEKDIAPGVDIKKMFDKQEMQVYPYFGFPPEWFDDDKLIQERMVAIVRPAEPQTGLYEDTNYSVKDLIESYELRRQYYEQHNSGG